MGCATSLVKYFVFLANLIFALAGLALVIIGVLYKVKYHAATDALPTDFGLAPILSIIIGAIVFITAFMGCCGAVKESPCMLTTYAIILLTIFIIQVAIGVYAFLKIKDEKQFRNTIHKGLTNTFDKYNPNIDNEAKETVDVIQKLLGCCGIDGPDDFDTKLFNNGTLPESCCWSSNEGPCQKSNSLMVHHDSCTQNLYEVVMKSSTIVGGVVLGIGAVELIGAFLGLCLASSIKNQYRRSLYA